MPLVGIGIGIPSLRLRRVSAGGVDPLIQALIDGDYDDGYFDAFGSASGFPAPGSDTSLATTRLDTPAAPIGNLVSDTDIVLNFTDDTPLILADSDFTVYKYFRITKSDHTSGAIYGSIGLSTDDFDPDLVVSTMSWTGGGTLNLSGVVHVHAVAQALTGYSVSVSNDSPHSGSAYTARAQAKAGGSDLHRIALPVTASYVSTAGAGDGSITNGPSFVTNRYGVTDTIDVTAGTYPTTEHIHVTDGSTTGDSGDVVVTPQPVYALVDSTGARSTGASTGATTPDIDTTGATLITIGVAMYNGTLTSLVDNKGNTYALRKASEDGFILLYDCDSPTVGSGHNFTVADTNGYTALAVAAFTGAVPTIDATNAAESTGDTVQPGVVNPAEDNELVVTAVRFQHPEAAPLSVDGGFTKIEDLDAVDSSTMGVALAYLIQTSAAGANPTWSGMNAGNAVGAAIVTYKAA